MFGVPLCDVLARDTERHQHLKPGPGEPVPLVPCFLHTAIDYLMHWGIEEEGVFRLAGSKATVQKLIAQVNAVHTKFSLLKPVVGYYLLVLCFTELLSRD